MYVGGRGNGNGNGNGNGKNRFSEGMGNEKFFVPSEYGGNALRDPEALMRAEEAFRRGYVFEENRPDTKNEDLFNSKNGAEADYDEKNAYGEDEIDEINKINGTNGIHNETSSAFAPEKAYGEAVKDGDGDGDEDGDEVKIEKDPIGFDAKKDGERAVFAQKKRNGYLSEFFGGIKTEQIIIIGLILILWESRADDELLIMLAILLFC